MKSRITTLLCLCASAALGIALAGCTFDRTGLGECRNDSECGSGSCVDRVCSDSVGGDLGGDLAADLGFDADSDGGGTDLGFDGGDAGCSDGARQCEGETAVTCEDGTEVRVDCSSDGACEGEFGCQCRAGVCDSNACLPDQVTCVGQEVVDCSESGNTFEVLETCTSAQICAGAQCVDLACTAGTSVCAGSVLLTCSDDGELEVVSDCASVDGFCDDANPSCQPRICTPDALRCSPFGNSIEYCDSRGAEWVPAVDCEGDRTCMDGECVGSVCEPFEVACLDSNTLSSCDATGTSLTETDCDEDQFCNDTLEPPACQTGVCAPFSSRCAADGEAVETCDSTGLAYSTSVDCDSDEFCDDGSCQTQICVPDSFVCLDEDTFEICDDRGTAIGTGLCTTGFFCDTDADQCTPDVCEPDATFCNDDDDVAVCNSSGSGSTLDTDCLSGCSDGVCEDLGCGDGEVSSELGETCDDENNLLCDGCESCRARHVVGVTPSTDVTSTSSWTPGTSDLSIEAWVNVTASGTLVGLGDWDGDYAVIGVTGGGDAYFQIDMGDDQTVTAVGGSVLNTGWHHIAACRTQVYSLALLVDGEVVDMAFNDDENTSIDGGLIWIGGDGSAPGATAQIDEVHISNICRRGSEFLPSRRNTPDGDSIALYHFDEGSGGTVSDASGNDRHLTVDNHTWVADSCYGGSNDSARCGDGQIAPFEDCDDGEVMGPTCNADCSFVSGCPAGMELGIYRHCYLNSKTTGDTEMTWTEAQAVCESFSGDLVTVEGTDENRWLTGLMDSDEYWIGLNDRATGGTHVWVSGSSATYRNWAWGQPGLADCARLDAGDATWNMNGCGNDNPFVCETVP